jgi:hypothetical protein
VVGILCEGVEDQTVALLTALDEDNPWETKRGALIPEVEGSFEPKMLHKL